MNRVKLISLMFFCWLSMMGSTFGGTFLDGENLTVGRDVRIRLLGGSTTSYPNYVPGSNVIVYICARRKFPDPCSGVAIESSIARFTGRESLENINDWLQSLNHILTWTDPDSLQYQLCLGRASKTRVFPAAFCTWLSGVSPTGECHIENNITLDHGLLNTKEINSHRASEAVSVSCSGRAGNGYTLSLKGAEINGNAVLNKGLYSRFYIDGERVDVNQRGIVVNNTTSRVHSIISELLTQGKVDEGVAQWSGTMILNIF
ncbi:MrpH family fimbial adhesin [Serratia fonticola]|uniref:MrpH family fimbial adhesin n=1 Tax=Serratia fonticola TaxID=47917 RepID=UPI0021774673|nr:hypothetical protein [Serratia fonticola]CAI2026036.1 Uncharacterised protein [Serratia fonticola]